ncbi:MAG: GtrA family protein [Nitrospiria bacterium]
MVGFSGVFVNLGSYFWLTRDAGMNTAVASPVAIELAILSNFLINHFWTFNERNNGLSAHQTLFRFHLVSGFSGLLNYLILLGLVYGFHVNDILSNLAGIVMAVLVNYSLNSLWTWKHTPIVNEGLRPSKPEISSPFILVEPAEKR